MPKNTTILKDFWLYLSFFALCLTHKGQFLFETARAVFLLVVGKFEQAQDFFVGKIMRRGGFLAPVHRLSLMSLVSSLAFSGIIMVGTQPLLQEQEIKGLLTQEQNLANEHEMLLGMQTSPETEFAENAVRAEVIEYQIQAGDTLSSIGEKYLVSVEALTYINEIKNENLLSLGETLKIPPVNGLIHQVKSGETVSLIAAKYEVPAQVIVDFNYLDEPYLLSINQQLIIPDAKIPQPEPVYYAAKPGDTSTSGLSLQTLQGSGLGSFVWPTVGRLTQYFSWYHTAVDIANVSCGTAVVAADSGTITFAGWWAGGGGNTVMINHGNGYVTKYAHLSGFARSGGFVNQGEAIGYVGATGRAYGCHLHFIVEENGRPINPLSVL